MRIQYSWRDDNRKTFNEWRDWDSRGVEDFSGCENTALDIRTRIVDDSGNVVEQTPPFKPAYYEYTGGTGGPPDIKWMTSDPACSQFKRRDDIKPTGRS